LDPVSDPLVRCTDPGIRIRTKMSRIPNTGWKTGYAGRGRAEALRGGAGPGAAGPGGEPPQGPRHAAG
jgi:hypothetical protein